MFNEFYKTIFGQLVQFDEQGNPHLTMPEHVDPDTYNELFTKYARRRREVEEFMREFESDLPSLVQELDDAILALKRKGVLNYDGATEIQAIGETAIPSLVKYGNFAKAIG